MREFFQRLMNLVRARPRMRDLAYLILGHARRVRRYVRQTWPGDDPVKDSRYHAVYVHYDRQGVVHDYVIEQLRQLVTSQFRITFVSNAQQLRETSVVAVKPFCRTVIWRRNVGYDFGAYKDGIAALGDLSGCERLLLMNDSVYGPLRPLPEVLAEIDVSRTDVWGITDSWDHHYHIQSYFILFFQDALESRSFQSFWRRFPYVNSKAWLIHNGEIRLTQILTQEKLRAAVLCPYWDVAKSVLAKLEIRSPEKLAPAHQAFLENLQKQLVHGAPVNPAHFFWETLVNDFKCPFIKRELIQSNPGGVVYTWRWPEVIGSDGGYDPELIRRHLQAN